jgi:prepilin signal peptidase PulO-like enzyme (type II secretory pathway)
MIYLISVLIFIIGLCIGSFLNALIYRLETSKKICFGRSICIYCKKTLSWKELFPLLSFIIQKGKCKDCKKKISWQYPLVELVTGFLFLYSFFYVFSFQLLYDNWLLAISNLLIYWFIIAVLIVVFVYDLKHKLILDKVMIPGIIIVFVLQLFLGVLLLNLLLAGLIGGGFFLIQFLLSKGKWIGGGDIRLGVFMGFVLSWPNILVGLFIAYFIGAFASVILILSKKKGLKSQVPFGPFLAVGTLVSMFLGSQLVEWYLRLL